MNLNDPGWWGVILGAITLLMNVLDKVDTKHPETEIRLRTSRKRLSAPPLGPVARLGTLAGSIFISLGGWTGLTMTGIFSVVAMCLVKGWSSPHWWLPLTITEVMVTPFFFGVSRLVRDPDNVRVLPKTTGIAFLYYLLWIVVIFWLGMTLDGSQSTIDSLRQLVTLQTLGYLACWACLTGFAMPYYWQKIRT